MASLPALWEPLGMAAAGAHTRPPSPGDCAWTGAGPRIPSCRQALQQGSYCFLGKTHMSDPRWKASYLLLCLQAHHIFPCFPQESSLNHFGFEMLSLFSQTAAMAAFHTTRKQRNHSTWKAQMLSVSKDTDFSTQAGCFWGAARGDHRSH